MKKSKHYRKDVILARVIFAALCIVILVLIGLGISALVKNFDKGVKPPKPQTENTQVTENTELDVEIDTEDDQQDTEDVTEVAYYVQVTNDNVSLRSEPNTDCEILARLYTNDEAELLEELDGWYKVSYNGQVGYISADFSTIIEKVVSSGSYVIMIDPGHQLEGDSETEPNGPDSTEMKARVTSGTVGVETGVYEYELNLEIALMLRDELEARGYTVLLTREVHDVNISNMERALMANEAGADITVRIHANSHEDSSADGAEALAPSTSNPYCSDIAEQSQELSSCVLNAYCEATGMDNRKVKINDTMTGINWCEMPVTILELGFMSNPTDDTNMQDDAYQQKMVSGIADGIDEYFGK